MPFILARWQTFVRAQAVWIFVTLGIPWALLHLPLTLPGKLGEGAAALLIILFTRGRLGGSAGIENRL